MASKQQTWDYQTLGRQRKLTDPSVRNERAAVAPPDASRSSTTRLVDNRFPGRSAERSTGKLILSTGNSAKSPGGEATKAESWSVKTGHSLSFLGLALFTVMLYFRPYEIFPSAAWLSSVPFWLAAFTLAVFFPSQFALEGNLSARPKEVNLILILGLAAFLSVPLAIDSGTAWGLFSGIFIKVVLMFLVMVNVVRTEKRLRLIMLLVLAACAIVSVTAVNDYRLGKFSSEGYRVTSSIQKASGMFGDPNDMALSLLTALPIATAFALTARNPIKKALYAVTGLLLILGTVFTFSRGGFLGLIAVLGTMIWKLGRRNRAVVSVLMVVVLSGFLVLAPGNYMGRMASIFNPSSEASASNRKELLIRGIVVSVTHPLGIGMGNFNILSIKDKANHNGYLQVSTELGLVALVVYIMLMLSPIRKLRQIELECAASSEGLKYYYLAIGLQASLIGYMVSSFFLSVAYNWHLYYIVAFAICLRRLYLSRSTDPTSVRDARRGVPAALKTTI